MGAILERGKLVVEEKGMGSWTVFLLVGNLLVQVGEGVLDAENVHQLLGEGAGNGAVQKSIVSFVHCTEYCRQRLRLTIEDGDRWAASQRRARRRFGPW